MPGLVGKPVMASRCLAYFLWLIGGLVGLHHLYLGRRVHAFAWLVSLGGFGFGWLCDACLIGRYVDEANCADEVSRSHRVPVQASTSHYRFAGQIAFGSYLGALVGVAIPFQLILFGEMFGGFRWPDLLASILVGFGVAWGVHVVGNIGQQQRTFTGALSGALPTSLILYFALDQSSSYFWISIASAIRANATVKSKKNNQHSWSLIVLWAVIFYSLWSLIVLNSVQVQVTDESSGKELYMTLGQAFLRNLRINGDFGPNGVFSSWTKFKQFVLNFFVSFTIADNDAFEDAWTILGIEPGSSQRIIRHHCRELLASHHPDRINSRRKAPPVSRTREDSGGSATKEFDLNKYTAIQSACELLVNDRSQKLRNVRRDTSGRPSSTDGGTKQEL